MDSTTQIGSVKFDDHFRMTYIDPNGLTIGMGNISAGMKQITAQAFLWAMKDVARASVPVVIDTPLARIDSGNQRLLIKNFYPAAAEQVIVLPTDSELDLEKYELLKPYIAAEFHLSNPKGDSTTVSEGVSMYSREAA
jgi:DNA sulfur modification protein DndD